MDKTGAARLRLILSMSIFGTIGVFARYIPLPSSVTANVRGVTGALFLLGLMALRRKRLSFAELRGGLLWLLLSGALLGFNWMLLFDAYRYTSVATATLCYYLSPIIVVALSPLLFKEKLTLRKILCVAAALIGMVFVSGVFSGGGRGTDDVRGMLLGLGAALLYAAIVVLNKRLKGVPAMERTVMQLLVAAVVLLPYNLLTVDMGALSITPLALAVLLTVGVVHTGLAFYLYFGSMEALPSQSVALLSYIDPVVAVLASALLLREPVTAGTVIGALLILGAAAVAELPEKEKKGHGQ